MPFRRMVLVLGVVAIAVALALVWNILGGWPVPSGYSFPRHSMFSGQDALFVGTLEDVDGCIRATGERSFAVVWPPGYWLSIEDGEPVVHGFAREAGLGEFVRMGGGYYEDGQPPSGSRDVGNCAPPYFLSTGHRLNAGDSEALPGVVVPLARLETALHVGQLSLGEELDGDLGQAIPRHARVVLRPLRVGAAELVRRDRERLQQRRLHQCPERVLRLKSGVREHAAVVIVHNRQ